MLSLPNLRGLVAQEQGGVHELVADVHDEENADVQIDAPTLLASRQDRGGAQTIVCEGNP